MRTEIAQLRQSLQASLSGRRLVSPDIASEFHAAEASLPDGATALDVTNDSFLLTNHDHKTILMDDWPGAAGPPPGWPLTQRYEEPLFLRDIFQDNSVRYIIFSYKYANWTSLKACQFFPSVGHFLELDEELELLSLVALHQFNQLRTSHQTIYDDGSIAVIDLQSPVASVHTHPTGLDARYQQG